MTNLEELLAFYDSLKESIKENQEYNKKLLQLVLRKALQPNIEV